MMGLFKTTLVLCGIAGFGIFQGVERFPEYAGPFVRLTSVETVKGRVTHVRDGDTIEVKHVPVRFGSLDCAERGSSAGDAATAAMRDLAGAAELTCYLNGRNSYDRRIGSCQLPDGQDVAGLMIVGGHCGRFW